MTAPAGRTARAAAPVTLLDRNREFAAAGTWRNTPRLPFLPQVAAGERATCATLAGGAAECWGSGTLGDAASNSPLTVAPVIGLPDS